MQKKLIVAAMAGVLMLLLVAPCFAQESLEMSEPEECTDCNETVSGLQSLNDTDLSNTSINPDLVVPELISPTGIQNSGRLTYTWKGGSKCQYYYLIVKNDQNNVVIKQWYSAFPAKAIYSKTPSRSLPSGVYTWSILCRDRGHYLSSEQMEFTVCTSSPSRATLVSPKDTIGSKNPKFIWMPVNGATEYRLKVAKASSPNEPIFDEIYDAKEVFSDTDQTCSVGPVMSQDLEEAVHYRWWVQTFNCMGEGPWSYYKDFKYKPVIPGKPSPISPRGLISTDSPTFIWTTAKAATEYHLEVYNRNKSPEDDYILVDEGQFDAEDDYILVDEGWFDADEVTTGSRCSGTLGTLPDDDPVYFWRVHASNDAGIDGPWSNWRYFEIICAFKPGKIAKKTHMG